MFSTAKGQAKNSTPDCGCHGFNLKIVPPHTHTPSPLQEALRKFRLSWNQCWEGPKAVSLSQYLRLTKLYPRAEGVLLARLFIYLFIFPEMNPMCLPRMEGRNRMEVIKYKEPFLKRKGWGGACRTKLLLEDLGF